MRLLKTMVLLELVSTALALSMNMETDKDMKSDMDMNMDMEHSIADTTSSIDLTELTPVPHEMKHMHGQPILETHLTPAERLFWESYNTTTFFTVDAPHKSALWFHVLTILGALFVIYPLSLVLNNVKSKWYIPSLTLHLVTIVTSLISLQIFASTAPLLYPGQAYGKMSWILLFATIIHYSVALLHSASKWISGELFDNEAPDSNNPHQQFIPLENLDLERGESNSSPSHSTLIDQEESSNANPGSPAYKDSLELGDDYYLPKKQSTTQLARDGILAQVFTHPRVQSISARFSPIISWIFFFINMPMLAYLFIYVIVGISVGNCLGQAKHVFNLLAHFIKGGVFVTLGVFTLARYCGVFAKQGLAWNKSIVFKNNTNPNSFFYRWTPQGMFTMEFYESFLIFFYGSTNIFLEHLASPGGAWDVKDLQHVSIAFMYIGAGLCGLITEKLLSDWRFNQMLLNTNINPSAIHAGSPGYSPNPFPVFTIFWTGILMSQHKQSSQISTNVHMQWGYLLAYGSFFRLISYVILMLQPNKNMAPSRPFTELITSFCLIAGGAIFMQSTDQVVQAMEYRGLTEMFTLNVNVGCVALLMSWEMILFIFKDKLSRK